MQKQPWKKLFAWASIVEVPHPMPIHVLTCCRHRGTDLIHHLYCMHLPVQMSVKWEKSRTMVLWEVLMRSEESRFHRAPQTSSQDLWNKWFISLRLACVYLLHGQQLTSNLCKSGFWNCGTADMEVHSACYALEKKCKTLWDSWHDIVVLC